MASKQGINTAIGIALSATSDTYGTAEALTEKLVVESLAANENATVLQSSGIGSGGVMSDNAARGNIAGSISISGICGFANGFPQLVAQMLGADSSTEQTTDEDDWLHQITASSTLNETFLTVVNETSSTTVAEYPSVTINSLNITATRGDYLRYSVEGLFDELVDTSPTNNNAAVTALTVTDAELAVVDETGDFQMNGQAAGALGSSGIDITDYNLTLTRPQEFIPEINASAGNGSPVQSDRMAGTLTISFKENADNTYFTAAQAGTEYKSSFTVTGSTIPDGDPKNISIFIPRMKLIQTPDYSLSSGGNNPVTLTFEILEASTDPTGMDDTTPYFEITNGTEAAYIA